MAKICGLSYTLRCKKPKGHKGRCHFVGTKRLGEAVRPSKKLVLPKREPTIRDLALIAEWMGCEVDVASPKPLTFTLRVKEAEKLAPKNPVRGGRFSASGGTEP